MLRWIFHGFPRPRVCTQRLCKTWWKFSLPFAFLFSYFSSLCLSFLRGPLTPPWRLGPRPDVWSWITVPKEIQLFLFPPNFACYPISLPEFIIPDPTCVNTGLLPLLWSELQPGLHGEEDDSGPSCPPCLECLTIIFSVWLLLLFLQLPHTWTDLVEEQKWWWRTKFVETADTQWVLHLMCGSTLGPTCQEGKKGEGQTRINIQTTAAL